MDTLEKWSVRIAQEVAPDEVDLAPLMAQAFVSGGDQRNELFQQSKSDTVGGFGLGEIGVILPWVLRGIAAAGPFLKTILTSGAINKSLSAVKDLLSIQESLERRNKASSLADDPYLPLKRAADVITRELESLSISQDQREVVAYRVLRVLLDGTDASKFVQEVAQAN